MERSDERTLKNYKRMTETPVSRLIVTLGIPTTISMLITSIYNLADTYFVGTLGESAQGATGILFTLQAIIQAFAFMLGHGSGAYVSKALANKDRREASEYASSAFFTGIGFGLVFMALGLSLLSPFMRLLGSTDTILPYACDYGFWVLLACPIQIGAMVLNNNLRYEGKAVFAMVGLTSGGILNILLDYIFVRVLPLGVFGAGMATAISQAVSFTLLLVFYFLKAESRLSFRHIARRVAVYTAIAKNGFPSLIRQGLTSISGGVLNNLTKPFGDAAIAAMSVVNRYSMLVMCVGLGIGQGFQPVASYNYEAKKYRRVKQGLLFTTFFGFALVGLLSLFGLLCPEAVISIFQKSPEVIEIGSFALRLSSVGGLFLPLSVPINMLYQSIRRADVATFLSMLRSGVLLIPLLFILSAAFGLPGIQASQPAADILVGLISIPFILHFLRVTPNENFDDNVK